MSAATSASQLFSGFTPSIRNQRPPSSLSFFYFHLKRRRFNGSLAISSSSPLHRTSNLCTNYNNECSPPQCLEPSHDDASSLSFPRPLSSTTDLTSPPDGPRLRVAYQGVSGANSEVAAETAYPNCLPVPCEQFDTAFEVGVVMSIGRSGNYAEGWGLGVGWQEALPWFSKT